MLKRNGFGYIKVDYNETVGFGCDHPDSPGEGLRRQVLGTYGMFRRLREVNPGLVIENCSSGGHRLEPSMFALSSMSSFSDAHEEPEIPVIAASLHRLMLPRQNQIWAVVKPQHELKKLGYILSSAMLGRFCLSGDILGLNDEQWAFVREAMEFYRRLVPVLKHGSSTLATMMSPRLAETARQSDSGTAGAGTGGSWHCSCMSSTIRRRDWRSGCGGRMEDP